VLLDRTATVDSTNLTVATPNFARGAKPETVNPFNNRADQFYVWLIPVATTLLRVNARDAWWQ